MEHPMRIATFVVVAMVASCAPALNTPLADIPKLTKLAQVMDNQSTTADPQFEKMGRPSYTDPEFAAFAETASRIDATSLKIKDFSKGADFDALAMRLNEKAHALADAARAKDAGAASAALSEMKATCKQCHSAHR
jgi:cytochrome c556